MYQYMQIDWSNYKYINIYNDNIESISIVGGGTTIYRLGSDLNNKLHAYY